MPVHVVLHHFIWILCCFVAFYPLPFVSRLVSGMFGSRRSLDAAWPRMLPPWPRRRWQRIWSAQKFAGNWQRGAAEKLWQVVLPPQSLPNMTDNESTQRTSVGVLPGRALQNLPKSALFHLAPCKWCKCFVLVWFLVVAERSQVHWCSGWWCSGFRDVTWQKGPTSHLVSPV